jgi:hypothetical protein
MNKRIATLTLVVSLFAASAFAAVEGAWTASVIEKKPERVQLNLNTTPYNNMGTSMKIADFTGLTRAQIDAATMTLVNFELRREAGTTSFEGTFRNGKGAGQFTFAPNRGFLTSIRALGIDVSDEDGRVRRHHREQSEEERLFAFALHDVTAAYIRSMQAEGYRVSLEKYLEMRIFDITPEYIREMRGLGFTKLDVDDLVGSRIHGVTPEYVREMRAAGWNLDLDELQSTRIHGATPKFAEEMKKLGYANLDIDDLVGFRIHGVTAKFITELRELGYDDIPADRLVEMRIHGVTPEFIREIKAAGYNGVPVSKLISMRIAGIDGQYLKKMSPKN